MTPEFTGPNMSTALQNAGSVALKEFIGKPVRCLEIGVYEGRSAIWLLENVLTHPDSTYLGIDLVAGHEEAHERAIKNLKAFDNKPNKVRLWRADSQLAVEKLNAGTKGLPKEKFDIVQIDGCHTERGCYVDMAGCWELLNPNGVMIVDDYLRADYGVAKAVHQFLSKLIVVTDYTILYWDYSIAWRKNR